LIPVDQALRKANSITVQSLNAAHGAA